MLRQSKKILALLLLFSTVLSGCGKKEKTASENKKKSSSISIEIPPMSTDGITYGVVARNNRNKLILQTDLGTTAKFEINKKTDTEEIKDDIKEGTALKITYTGKLTSGYKVADQVLESDKTPNLNTEALATASKIILAVKNKNLKALSEFCDYPLVMDKGSSKKVNSPQTFISLGKGKIFTDKFVKSISRTNLFVTNGYKDGFLLGDSKPDIVIQKMGKGYKITGFHYK